MILLGRTTTVVEKLCCVGWTSPGCTTPTQPAYQKRTPDDLKSDRTSILVSFSKIGRSTLIFASEPLQKDGMCKEDARDVVEPGK